jgi:hypothetical protein
MDLQRSWQPVFAESTHLGGSHSSPKVSLSLISGIFLASTQLNDLLTPILGNSFRLYSVMQIIKQVTEATPLEFTPKSQKRRLCEIQFFPTLKFHLL